MSGSGSGQDPPGASSASSVGCCSAGVGSGAGSGGGGRDEDGSGTRGARRRALFAPRCDRVAPLKRRLQHPDHACLWCSGLGHQPGPSQELHQHLPASTPRIWAPWTPLRSPPVLMEHPQNAAGTPRKGELTEVSTKPLRPRHEERAGPGQKKGLGRTGKVFSIPVLESGKLARPACV